MSDEKQTERANRFNTLRPPRERVFYANAVNFAVSEDQEGILDFKIVMPEDVRLAQIRKTYEDEDEESIRVTGHSIDLDEVPVEVRVYMPINQFEATCRRLGRLWERMRAAKEQATQAELDQTDEPEEA